MLSQLFADRVEGAFSNLKFWQSIAVAIAFVLRLFPSIHFTYRLYAVAGLLVVAVLSTAGLNAVSPIDGRSKEKERLLNE